MNTNVPLNICSNTKKYNNFDYSNIRLNYPQDSNTQTDEKQLGSPATNIIYLIFGNDAMSDCVPTLPDKGFPNYYKQG